MAGMQSPNVAAMGTVPQPHPQTMPGQPAPQGQVPPQPAPQQQTQQAPDAITKVRITVNKLKESLRNLMKISAQAFGHSASIDNAIKPTEDVASRFDKALEEFYSLCDQLELSLRLAHDCTTQYMEGARLTPVTLVHSHKPEMVPTEALTHGQYIATVKSQIQCAADVHAALLDCCEKLSHPGQT